MQTISRSADLSHTAVFYRSDEDFLAAVLPFVLDGVSSGESVYAALPTGNLALLRDALGDLSGEVGLADMADAGRNPARAFAMFASMLNSAAPEARIRVVGEPVWPGRSADEYPACVENEALVNLAWAGHQVSTLCPYDAANLSDEVLADARRTHPQVQYNGSAVPSPDYAWQEALAECNAPLNTDPAAVTYCLTQLQDLRPARVFATEWSHGIGLCAERAADLNLIITELATNSLKYTGGSCRLALWRRGEHIICEVRDRGRLADPLAGRRLPDPHSVGGRGLLLVNALADLVRIHSGATGTTIQAHVALTLPREEEP